MKNTIIKINNDSIKISKTIKWNIDQPDPTYEPDLFEPYARNEQRRQTRQNPTSYNKNIQSKNPVHTQNYQPTKMQNEITLP